MTETELKELLDIWNSDHQDDGWHIYTRKELDSKLEDLSGGDREFAQSCYRSGYNAKSPEVFSFFNFEYHADYFMLDEDYCVVSISDIEGFLEKGINDGRIKEWREKKNQI